MLKITACRRFDDYAKSIGRFAFDFALYGELLQNAA